jgi:tetraacyldisaccharide 4'-kinase
VISVGNITAGGTGKTPLVEWLARHVQSRGHTPVIVSRGYRAQRNRLNDEAQELALKLPGVPHVQNADRVAAAQRALAAHPGSVIILDDGFQHRRLARDLDLVLLDALCSFGYERLLPRGFLREPPSGLARADAVILSRADLITAQEREAIRLRAANLSSNASWIEARHAPRRLVSQSESSQPIEWLAGKRVAAFCGIGNPAGFRKTLEGTGCEIVAWREFPDHFAYSPSAVAELSRWLPSTSAEAALCTLKDLVKIGRSQIGDRPLYALEVGLEFLSGESQLSERINNCLSRIS